LGEKETQGFQVKSCAQIARTFLGPGLVNSRRSQNSHADYEEECMGTAVVSDRYTSPTADRHISTPERGNAVESIGILRERFVNWDCRLNRGINLRNVSFNLAQSQL